MQLHFASRSDYRRKTEDSFIEELRAQLGDFYLVPEGGSNLLGVKGCTEIVKEISIPFDHICTSCGTGATLAGIALSLGMGQQAIGFSSLKGGEFLEEEVRNFIKEYSPADFPPPTATPASREGSWWISHDYHFGRYAKVTSELESFILRFRAEHNIPLDHVYTGKMMFGIYDLVRTGFFVPGETIVALHTGGLQGAKGNLRDNTF
jgi:1-aminocyclopropane-1-carboxylate deaminase